MTKKRDGEALAEILKYCKRFGKETEKGSWLFPNGQRIVANTRGISIHAGHTFCFFFVEDIFDVEIDNEFLVIPLFMGSTTFNGVA